MKRDAIAFGVAGIVFGLIAGWIIGSQYAKLQPQVPPPSAQQTSAPPPAVVDENQVSAFKAMAEREPSNPAPRVQLAGLYFAAERYDEARQWYEEALKLSPKDVEVSTDLGLSYLYTNQTDRALQQLNRSLKIDPKHLKTLLYVGMVRAFGKQDLPGAQTAWERVIKLAPESREGQQAKRALDQLRDAHAATGGPPSGSE